MQHLKGSIMRDIIKLRSAGTLWGLRWTWDPKTSLLSFSIKDENGSQTLPVRFRGDKPDRFTDNLPVIVFGQLDSSGEFVATKLLVKCPSKYSTKDKQRTYTTN